MSDVTDPFQAPEDPAQLWESSFALFLLSRFCVGVAQTIMRAALAWQVFELSNSAFALGFMGLVQLVPALTLTLVGGAVADSFDRRRISMLAQVVPLACGATLCAASMGGWIGLPLLFGTILLRSTAAAFENPAGTSLLPLLVTREHFPRAVALQSTTRLIAFMIGPILMGVAGKFAGIGAAYGLHAVLVLVSIVALAFVRPRSTQAEPRGVSWHAVIEGLAYVWKTKPVLGAMSLDMFAVVFATATALLPIFAKDILGVGELGYGLLASSLEIGSVLSSLALVFIPAVHRPGRALLVAVGVFGIATIAFGLSHNFWLSFVAYILVGIADGVSVVMRGSIVQLSTPDELRGRVSSVNMVFIHTSNQLGAARAGFLAGLTSAAFTVVLGGVISIVVVAAIDRAIPGLRHYDTG